MIPSPDSDLFTHIRVVMGMVLGLGVSKLLTGFAGLVQYPGRYRLSVTHLLWAACILLDLIMFWWWEFALKRIETWSFALFLFIIVYTILLYLLAALLFPDSIDEYGGYEAYLIRRRYWFFGLLAATFVLDAIDTHIKGEAYWQLWRTYELVETPFGLLLCAVACATSNRRVHLGIASAYGIHQCVWIVRSIQSMA
ncbi:hypothetical protein [Dokdonella sp.]|uniref:hypothetical protein n=1 Tax=Dokdonella sp. TaxID=2291710 RepID=UPI0031CA118B|nr:hypothetical protein [Dokdonella sp.]